MYLDGIIEAMTQVEALRLAATQANPAELTSQDVLEKGFWQIKDMNTGGITVSNFTYGQGDSQGVDSVRDPAGRGRQDRGEGFLPAPQHPAGCEEIAVPGR